MKTRKQFRIRKSKYDGKLLSLARQNNSLMQFVHGRVCGQVLIGENLWALRVMQENGFFRLCIPASNQQDLKQWQVIWEGVETDLPKKDELATATCEGVDPSPAMDLGEDVVDVGFEELPEDDFELIEEKPRKRGPGRPPKPKGFGSNQEVLEWVSGEDDHLIGYVGSHGHHGLAEEEGYFYG